MTEQIRLKTDDELQKMRIAGQLASEVLDFITPYVVSGVNTAKLDELCHQYMVEEQGTIPAPLHYCPPGHTPYPKSICTSVNHVICHGIPGDYVLKKGDIINIDVTVIKNGYHGDTSRMFCVDPVSNHAKRLVQKTHEAMWCGINEVKPGKTTGDIGHAIQQFAESLGYSVVREFCGHGIGTNFHEEPQILHYGKPGTGIPLKEGMVFTIEPMINQGNRQLKILRDGWTTVTKDRSLSAQWEHTIAVTQTGYEVLTLSQGTPAPFDPNT